METITVYEYQKGNFNGNGNAIDVDVTTIKEIKALPETNGLVPFYMLQFDGTEIYFEFST